MTCTDGIYVDDRRVDTGDCSGPRSARVVLPASALLGALLLVLADAAARWVLSPTELPIGILTALVGGPFFFALLLRRREAVLG